MVNMKTGEVIDIQPQPGKGEGFERFNWDAPILVSPHNPQQIYFASQMLWRSDNRGDSWTAISSDLMIKSPCYGANLYWLIHNLTILALDFHVVVQPASTSSKIIIGQVCFRLMI